MFKSIFISSEDDVNIEERSYSMSGGLENDALRLAAESHFSFTTTDASRLQQRQEIEQILIKQGADLSSPQTQQMIASFQSQSSGGGGAEIIVLSLPCKDNEYIGVSIYCDRNGQSSNKPINKRVTSLAAFCQHKTSIYGDAFIGRYHDDERYEWKRLDFSLSDMKSEAAWVLQTQKMNRGKNMGGLSTSGQMHKIINNQPAAAATAAAGGTGGGESITAPPVFDMTPAVPAASIGGNTTWSDTGDDIEVTIRLADSVKKSDLSIAVRSTSLQFSCKDPTIDATTLFRDPTDLNPIDTQILGSDELAHMVDASTSTWTMERTKTMGLHVLFTLCKKDEGTIWTELYR